MPGSQGRQHKEIVDRDAGTTDLTDYSCRSAASKLTILLLLTSAGSQAGHVGIRDGGAGGLPHRRDLDRHSRREWHGTCRPNSNLVLDRSEQLAAMQLYSACDVVNPGRRSVAVGPPTRSIGLPRSARTTTTRRCGS